MTRRSDRRRHPPAAGAERCGPQATGKGERPAGKRRGPERSRSGPRPRDSRFAGDYRSEASSSAAPTCLRIQAVVTDLGRSMGVPIARFTTSCAHIPRARDTENSTV